jgi:hypothetical protein
MDLLMVSGAALIVLLIMAGILLNYARRPKPAERTHKEDPDENNLHEAVAAQEEPLHPLDARSTYILKATALLDLLKAVKETEGIREMTTNEMTGLESQIASIKTSLEGGDVNKYSLRESEVRMAYAYSRIEWIIKSYPRIRNDSSTAALKKEIRKIDRKIDNLREEVE